MIKKIGVLILTCWYIIGAAQNQSPPNIIFLLTDDQRWDMIGANGNPIIQTPNIDQLASKGSNFTNHYVTTAICSVSRASILSGQYGRNHGLWGFGQGFSDEAFQDIYPMVLQQSGYEVGFIGKYGVGPIGKPKDAFDYWGGFANQGTYHHQNGEGSYLHLTEKIGNQMLDFLNMRDDSKPFCLSVSFKSPHAEDGAQSDPAKIFPSDPAFLDEYEDEIWIRPMAGDEQYFDHFPQHFTDNNEAVKRYNTRFESEVKYDASLEGYYRLVHGVDVQVGRLIQALKENGLDDNTIIIFTSDHGFYLGEYGFAGKWYGSEPSIKVPLVIYNPRDPTPQKVDAFSLNIDLASTILDYANVNIPDSYDGQSLVPIVKDNSLNTRDSFYYEHLWPPNTGYNIPSTEGIVTKNFKYMRYFEGFDESKIIFEELYERGNDPHEIHNFNDDPDYFSDKRRLQKAVDFFFQYPDPTLGNDGQHIYPLQDAYVRNGPFTHIIPGLTDSRYLEVKKSSSTGFERKAYLTYDLTAIEVDATEIQFEISGQSSEETDLLLLHSDQVAWVEYGLNWSIQPTTTWEEAGTIEVKEGNSSYELPITELVKNYQSQGKSFITFKLEGAAAYIGDPVIFESKDNASNKPKITFQTISSSSALEPPAVELFPNPVKDVLNINDWNNFKSISIYDNNGRQVYFAEEPVATINMSSMKSGIYIVHLNALPGSTKKVKVVKI